MSANIVITIIPDNLVVEEVDPTLEDPIVSRKAFGWKKGNLGTALESAIESFENLDKFRMLISDAYCHVVGFEVEKKHSADRDHIQKLASEYIPEDLNSVKWDYAIKNSKSGKNGVQVFTFSQFINDEFAKMSNAIKSKIELVLPCSLSLIESIAENDESFLLIYSDEVNQTIVSSQDGLVKFVTIFTSKNISNKILEVMNYLSKFMNFVPKKVIVSGNISQTLTKELMKNFQVVMTKMSSSSNLAEISRVSGQDQKILNISFVNNESNLAELEEVLSKKTVSGKKSKLIFIFSLLFVSVVGVIFGYLVVLKFR